MTWKSLSVGLLSENTQKQQKFLLYIKLNPLVPSKIFVLIVLLTGHLFKWTIIYLFYLLEYQLFIGEKKDKF